MAFASTITARPKSDGIMRISRGTYASSGGSTGGDIDTGLNKCHFIVLQGAAAAVTADAPVVNETLPCDGTAVTIVTTANSTGVWEAKGF
jgi:hypothetical protein